MDEVIAMAHDMAEPLIDHLPPEIMGSIFLLCLPIDTAGIPSTLAAPLLLGKVSRRWRDISLSTPELWNSFHLHLKSPYNSYGLASAMQLWISRSGSLPLSLGLSFTSTFAWIPSTKSKAIMDVFIPYMHQCRCFTLRFVQPGITREGVIFCNFPWPYMVLPVSLPLLEEIDLDVPFGDARKFLDRMFNKTETPLLKKVSLAGFPSSLLNYIPHSTLNRLTHLHSTSAESVQKCCNILHLSPNLKVCRFDLHSSDHVRKALINPIPITHHSLERLYVGPTNLNLFFKSTTFPALKSLSINGKTVVEWGPDDDLWGPTVRYPAKWGQPAFITFLTRSLCSLTKLSFFQLTLTSASLIQCLEAVSPNLAELHIEGGEGRCIDQSVMNVLTYRRPDQPRGTLGSRFFCPKLERLRLRGYIFSFGGSGKFMLDMLESRYRQVWPMEDLSQLKWVFVGGSYLENQWKRIEALERDGLELLVVEEGNKYLPNYLGDPTLFDCEQAFHGDGPRVD